MPAKARDTVAVYMRIGADIHPRIIDAARKDNRSTANWIDQHFRDFFKEQDERCESKPSSSDSS